jgi:hypothetical protein
MSTDGESPVYFLLALPPSAELAEIFATVVEKVRLHHAHRAGSPLTALQVNVSDKICESICTPTNRGDTLAHLAALKVPLNFSSTLSCRFFGCLMYCVFCYQGNEAALKLLMTLRVPLNLSWQNRYHSLLPPCLSA